jgi:menaquinone-dependent protoporphyrinogen oxidase
VYCSRYGTTDEIAKRIAKVIEKKDVLVNLINLKGLKKSSWPNVDPYDGLIVGTGIKIGKWTKEISEFLHVRSSVIESKKLPVAIFVSSGDAAFPKKYEKAKNMYIVEKLKELKKFDLDIVLIEAFAGVLDLTKDSPFSWLDKKVIQALAKEQPEIILDSKNDFRDWQKIESFAESYINLRTK